MHIEKEQEDGNIISGYVEAEYECSPHNHEVDEFIGWFVNCFDSVNQLNATEQEDAKEELIKAYFRICAS